ncbi:MAG: hypothetical protein JWM83_799 [Candidatus Angelobacter sp.]|nr:hypothetical protein [Candidatus Angelobacter sp.]
MFGACILLIIAIIGGTLLTFLFDRTAPRGARLCMGAAIGLALMATVGFLLALVLGLGAASIILTSVILLSPLLLLANRERRALILYSLRPQPSAARKSSAAGIGYLAFYLAIAILLAMVFGRAVFERPDGIYTGVTNNLGDLPLHLQVINSFVQGHNLPPEDPTFAGVRFAYPFLVDFLAAMLVRAGAGVILALWLQNMVMALALVGLLHYWTILLTRNRLAGVIAPLLVLFNGGLGWWLLFSDSSGGDGFFSMLASLQHDYTVVPNSILRWGNSLTTLFVPQRSILFGMPLAITIFCQWWVALSLQEDAQTSPADPTATSALEQPNAVSAKVLKSRSKRSRKAAAGIPQPEPQGFYLRRMLAAGLCAGFLPLIHAHTFLVVMAVAVCLALIFRSAWRGWLYFFIVALVIAIPEVVWLANSGGVNIGSYLGWQPGWDHGQHNIAWFWFVNTGLFIPLLVIALFWRRGTFKLPPRLVRFYVPFAFCFIIPNLVKVAPWIWDNIKVLFLWYVASAPLVAWFLARWWQQRSFFRWLAPAVLATLVLAGALDVLRVVSEAAEYQEFDASGIAAASLISAQAPPRAVVLHAPTFNSPVFLTGRRSLLGFPAWMWSRGLDYSQRGADIERIYSGDPEAEALLRKYNVDYVLVGPLELAAFKVNEQFWSKYKRVSPASAYRVYQITGDLSK